MGCCEVRCKPSHRPSGRRSPPDPCLPFLYFYDIQSTSPMPQHFVFGDNCAPVEIDALLYKPTYVIRDSIEHTISFSIMLEVPNNPFDPEYDDGLAAHVPAWPSTKHHPICNERISAFAVGDACRSDASSKLRSARPRVTASDVTLAHIIGPCG